MMPQSIPPSIRQTLGALRRCGRDPVTGVAETGALPLRCADPERNHPGLESAAVVLYRSAWWATVPECTPERGRVICPDGRTSYDADVTHGEIPWR